MAYNCGERLVTFMSPLRAMGGIQSTIMVIIAVINMLTETMRSTTQRVEVAKANSGLKS